MIKKIKEIPTSNVKKSKKQLLHEDFMQAINSGVEKFEFVGSEYNYNYLDQYARDEAKRIVYFDLSERLKKLREQKQLPRIYIDLWKFDYTKYLLITKSFDSDGRKHVYCQIFKDGLDILWNEHVLPKIKEDLKQRGYVI